MDVSSILASQDAKLQSITVEKDIPLQVDASFLTVYDPNPIDEDSYNTNLEEYLQSTARDGTQALIAALFSLPTRPSPDGPVAQLPPPTTQLPRAKPLPKPKPPTKWERFAAAKGITHKTRERKVWNEERQEWVNRWGRGGKNKEDEQKWLTEVPHNADIDFDPAKEARKERKARVAKNEEQRSQNTARAMPNQREERKHIIDKTLATTRISTASMGRFDKTLEGEKKMKGVKRKFEPTETPIENEKKASLALISKLDSDTKKIRKEPAGESVLNVRKAVRFASKGRGALALAKESAGSSGHKHSGKRGRGTKVKR